MPGGALHLGTLTLVGADGRQSLSCVGNETDNIDGYSNLSRNAEVQTLRRATMADGLGRALWRR